MDAIISEKRVAELQAIAREVRLKIVGMIYEAQSGHPGPALSATDMGNLTSILRMDGPGR